MMRVIFVFLFLAGLLTAAWAHPPTDIKLTYDSDTEVLHVSLKHVTHDPREHMIRRIVVYKNGQETETHYFVKQTSTEGLEEDFSISARSGDVIGIKAICSQAGYGEAELTIPERETR